MSQSYDPAMPAGSAARNENGSLDTARTEAAEIKDTAVSEAGHVAETAKDEARAVGQEVKTQARDLYLQTQRELSDQANAQQQRVASGLRSVSDELESMSANAQNPGVAADLVRQASDRLSGAASWLGDRDAASLLREVKSFARRQPGTFILGAAIVGVVAGRLTRALASNASDTSGAGAGADATTPVGGASPAAGTAATTSAGGAGLPTSSSELYATPPTVEQTPVYAQSSGARATGLPGEGGGDVRSDTV